MILANGEKVHIIHRRQLEHEPHRHFVGIVEGYDSGMARVLGHLYTVDREKGGFVRRPDQRTRIIALSSGECIVNVLPSHVNLDNIVYHQEKKVIRVTDGGDWHLDITEVTWL